jgi:hypothetical protein
MGKVVVARRKGSGAIPGSFLPKPGAGFCEKGERERFGFAGNELLAMLVWSPPPHRRTNSDSRVLRKHPKLPSIRLPLFTYLGVVSVTGKQFEGVISGLSEGAQTVTGWPSFLRHWNGHRFGSSF